MKTSVRHKLPAVVTAWTLLVAVLTFVLSTSILNGGSIASDIGQSAAFLASGHSYGDSNQSFASVARTNQNEDNANSAQNTDGPDNIPVAELHKAHTPSGNININPEFSGFIHQDMMPFAFSVIDQHIRLSVTYALALPVCYTKLLLLTAISPQAP